MGTQSGGIEVGWGKRRTGSAIVEEIHVEERWAVLHEDSRTSTTLYMLSGREADVLE